MRFLFKSCFAKKKPEMKPGAILDQVISQSSSSANRCLLYKLANFKGGGDLIDAINTGGIVAVEQLVREQFAIFMYQNGKGQIINRAEFLRWKYRDHTEVVIPIEASLSIHDPLGKWYDHKACWQMQYRGSLGESLLHVLIICDSKIHTKLARVLLRVFPVLALDVIEGEEYLGASALHLAISYSNNELVADLIEAGADINQRAIGSFFLPRDQQKDRPAKNTDYEGLAYMGEYPLAWAACCANESVYNLLIDNGADPDAQDSFGNMILHMVVVCDKLDMFGYALRHPKTPAKNGIANLSGLTPLTLACKLGRAEVFREMLELSSKEFWRYSNITCSGYPLNALDTLLPDGRTNWNSALFIILNGTKEEHLDMLDGGIIQRLLEEKWKTFARNQFLKRLLILFIHLLFLSVSVYLRPSKEEVDNQLEIEKDGTDNHNSNTFHVKRIVRYCSELGTIGGVLSYVIFQQGDEVKNQGLSAFLKQLSHAPAKAIFLVSNLMILACIPFRLIGDNETEEAILVFAVPGSWFLLMFFAGAVRLTGPFVTMIYSMLTGDMFTFGIIYTIVLFGFCQAFYFLFKGHAQVQSTMFNTFPSTWMALFQTTLGDYNYPDLNQTSYPNLAKTVFVIFMIFVPILLLNMLIAMMGNTYAHVIEQSEKEWMKQWAKIVVTLERAVPQSDAQKYLEAYSIPLGPSDDSGFEQRGVMVIKSKSKTRAKQRKGAVSNWKHVGKVTLNALKKRGMTGEQMRRMMWGRASISSPVKILKIRHKDPYNVTPDVGSTLGDALDIITFDHQEDTFVSQPIHSGTVPSQVPSSTAVPAPPVDPIRELLILSETNSDLVSQNVNLEVKKLASMAVQLADQGSIIPSFLGNKPISAPSTIPPLVQPSTAEITGLSSLFQDAKDIIDPEKLKAFQRHIDELEETDDSDMGGMGKPILGKINSFRRAKETMSEVNIMKWDCIDENSLFSTVWSDLIKMEKSSQSCEWGQIGSMNPTFSGDDEVIEIEQNFYEGPGKDNVSHENITTAEEVKSKMAEFHLKRRQHVGDEVSRQGKSARIKRRNKISPGLERAANRRAKSAAFHKHNTQEEMCPDPLEPWSTRELQSLNKILGSK